MNRYQGRARRRGPRGDVSVEALLRAAEEVLEAEGLPGLSLRSVARTAGVTPNALYTYFDDMADLRNRLGDRFLGRLDLDLLQEPRPRQALRGLLHQVLSVFDASPGHVQLLAAQRIVGPHSLALNEALLHFFISTVGHPPQRAADITVFVTEWVHGRVLLSPSNTVTEPSSTALERLDLAAYPRTAEMQVTAGNDAGIDLVIEAAMPGCPSISG